MNRWFPFVCGSYLAVTAARADAAEWYTRFKISPRAEQAQGRSEFFAPQRQTNPFPVDLATTQKTAAARRFATAVSELEGYQAVRSLFAPVPAQDLDGTTYSLFAEANAGLRWTSGWSVASQFASRQISRSAIDDGLLAERARNTFFIDELYGSYDRWDEWRSFAAGRMLLTTGRGFIHDDYQLVVKGSADLDLIGWAPFAVKAAAAKIETEEAAERSASTQKSFDGGALFNPDSNAYYGQAGISVPFSLLEQGGLTYARFQERDGYFADLFNPILGETYLLNQVARRTGLQVRNLTVATAEQIRKGTPASEAMERLDASLFALAENVYPRVIAIDEGIIDSGTSFLNYLMVDGDKYVGKVGLSWLVIGEWGRVTLEDFTPAIQTEIGTDRIDFQTRGLLLYGAAEYPISKKWLVRGHYLFSSGDNAEGSEFLQGDTYDSFLGLRPYIRLTNLFFSGGISDNLRTGSITPSGYFGHGVWTPVLDIEWSPTDKIQLVSTSAYFNVQREPSAVVDQDNQRVGAARGESYGWETDLMAYYQAARWLRLAAEADYFAPGDFFIDMPRVWKVGLGVDVVLEMSSEP